MSHKSLPNLHIIIITLTLSVVDITLIYLHLSLVGFTLNDLHLSIVGITLNNSILPRLFSLAYLVDG